MSVSKHQTGALPQHISTTTPQDDNTKLSWGKPFVFSPSTIFRMSWPQLAGGVSPVCLAFQIPVRPLASPPRSISLPEPWVLPGLGCNNPNLRDRKDGLVQLKSNVSQRQGEKRPKRQRRLDVSQILDAALLIAGTTVGGGFLALPTVVAPSGFHPSATALIGVWAYFLLESFVVVECLLTARTWNLQQRDSKREQELAQDYNPGIAATAKSVFGSVGELVVIVLLVILTQATLVSQISRAGSLFSPLINYRTGCSIVALSVAAVVFGRQHLATTLNSILTCIFVAMAVVLFGAGRSTADWSRLAAGSSWSALPSAIPTFLQLLVYGEILPTVCQLLNYKTRAIRLAILLGSLLPLGLEVGWAALGMALVPPGGVVGDPVDWLLAAAGPVQGPLFTLAVTAILTTIIGSYLALQSSFNDVFPPPIVSKQETSKAQTTKRRWLSAALIVTPALAIASVSPDLFLRAIDFAGSYPVVLLWGIAPPAIAWRQRQRGMSDSKSLLPTSLLLFLATLSLGVFGMAAAPDVALLARRLLPWGV